MIQEWVVTTARLFVPWSKVQTSRRWYMMKFTDGWLRAFDWLSTAQDDGEGMFSASGGVYQQGYCCGAFFYAGFQRDLFGVGCRFSDLLLLRSGCILSRHIRAQLGNSLFWPFCWVGNHIFLMSMYGWARRGGDLLAELFRVISTSEVYYFILDTCKYSHSLEVLSWFKSIGLWWSPRANLAIEALYRCGCRLHPHEAQFTTSDLSKSPHQHHQSKPFLLLTRSTI